MEIQLISHKNEEMHCRLEKASLAGDVDELRRMLQEDNLLLHQPNLYHPMNNPLHIASALGHTNFVKEILARKPEYAISFNARGLTALHLACANGHLSVVRELVQLSNSFGAEICDVRDKDGFLPIHTAALAGNVQILEEMLGLCSHVVVRGLTCLGDSILHLAVKSNCFEAIKFLIEKMESDQEFLNMRDAKGNTMLHLAIVRKQLQTVKFLLGKEWTDVNAKNNKGCTIFDVLLESPSEPGDLLLGVILQAAGGAATETSQLVQSLQPTEQTAAPNNNPSPCINWKSIKHLFLGFSHEGPSKYRETQHTLMVVNTLIATVTFQGGLNPPGGFAQFDDRGKKFTGQFSEEIEPGQALIANWLIGFLFWDIAVLLSSLSVILLMICGCPQLKGIITTSIIMTWIAVFSTGSAFVSAIPLIFPPGPGVGPSLMTFFVIWYFIMTAFAFYNLTRFHISIHQNISRYIINKSTRRDGRARCFFLFATHASLLQFIKVCMVASCIATCGAFVLLIYYILVPLSSSLWAVETASAING